MKNSKRILALLLALATVLSMCVVPAFAAAKVNVNTSKYFTLKNVGSGKYLNIYGNQNRNNVNVDVYAKDGTSGQDFKFTRIDSGKNSYTLTPRCATGRRVNVYGDSAKNKSNVCLWSRTNHSTQCWIPEAVSGGYILRCANNTNYVLTATGSRNSSNVNIQKYSAGNKYQIWTCSAFSTTTAGTTATPAASTSTAISPAAVKQQIKSTYQTAFRMRGKSFNGWCGQYVTYQLHALGIINKDRDSDCWGNGNQWYNSVKSGKTTTGYTKTKLAGGKNCLANIVKTYGDVQNIVISYPHAYGYTRNDPGHVVFIHAVINNTVYYSECYPGSDGVAEGAVRTKSVTAFDSAYTSSYRAALGAIYFHK